MTTETMKTRHVMIFLLLAAATCRSDPAPALPNFDEVYQILSTNLEGASTNELNSAAVLGLIRQLEPQVSLAANEAGTSNAAPLAEARVFDKSFAYCRVATVTSNLPDAFRAAFHQMAETNKSQIKGLVLDLRFAGGFDYAGAAKMADCFLSSERPLLDWQTGSAHATIKTHVITMPVAILVNSQTAGAAEALAAVLRDADVGLILGGQTAGKASIFREFPLRDGGTLRVAVAPVRFGAGKTLTHGVKPDIAINTSVEDERAYLGDPSKVLHPLAVSRPDAPPQGPEEPRINEVELIRERHKPQPSAGLPVRGTPDALEPPPVVTDPVLARALDLLKGLAVVQPNRQG